MTCAQAKKFMAVVLGLTLAFSSTSFSQTSPREPQAPIPDRAAAERAYEAGKHLQEQRTAETSRQAIVKFNEALAQWRALGDRYYEARTLFDLAHAHLSQGQRQTALDLFQQSLQLWRALGDRNGEATTLNSLGTTYLTAGEWQRALDHYLQSLNLSRAAGQRQYQSFALSNLGLLYRTLGEFRQAAAYYEQAFALNRNLNDRLREAVTLHNLGELYLLEGDFQKSLAYCQRALPLHREVKDSAGAAHTLDHLGTIYFKQGKPQAALDHYRQALALRRESGFRQQEANSLGDLAAVYAVLGDEPTAREHYRQALAIAREFNIRGIEARVLAGLAELDRKGGRLETARAHIEAALAIINQQRLRVTQPDLRASFFATRRDYYEFYLDVLMRLHERHPTASHQAAALEASEQSRARSLLDLLAEAKIELSETAMSQPLKPNEIQQLIAPDAALLEYVIGRESSFLFVVTRAELHSYRLPPSSEIVPLVRELRAALSHPGRGALGRYTVAARKLYELLVAPAAEVLREKQSLLIAPDGALHALPFEALLDDFKPPGYLLKRWAISYAPSASVLARLRRAPSATIESAKQFVAFADPVYEIASTRAELVNRTGLSRLPETSREAAGIARLYSSDQVALYLRQAAREENLRNNPLLAAARRIHFATHGRINEQPATSGLLLTQTDAEDGLLQLNEVFQLKLNAELVVLSACETGLGRELQGEGLMGLPRAFLFAGAASVAVSLWQVGDASTAELMVKFYERLNRGDGKAEALRQARLELIAAGRFAHPYHWAAFVLIGQPR